MKKKKNDYFELMEKQVGYCVSAAALLEKILHHVTKENIASYRAQMHEIEHQADDLRHEILSQLSAEFITPIDQEDILQLVRIVDDITDALDEVVIQLYMFCAERIPTDALCLCGKVRRCIDALLCAFGELRHFKKPEKLRQYLIEVNTVESEADECYIEAVHALFASECDGKTLLCDRAVYDNLEACCDMCEHAADTIEQIIIKNT